MNNLYDGIEVNSINQYKNDVDDSYNQNKIKELNKTIKIRNLSISVIVFTLIWLGLLTSFLCVLLLQVGFAEKFPTVVIKQTTFGGEDTFITVNSGFDFMKGYWWTTPEFSSIDQQNTFMFWKELCIGLAITAFIIFLVDNILLLVLKKVTDSVIGDFADMIVEGIFGFLFAVCGFGMILFFFNMIFDFFNEGWLLLIGVVLIVLLAAFAIAVSIVTVTLCAIVLSSHTMYATNKEIKSNSKYLYA